MKWAIQKEPKNGIMFSGESSVLVYNARKKWYGYVRVEYYPVCRVVGPVIDEETEEELDRRPTFEWA